MLILIVMPLRHSKAVVGTSENLAEPDYEYDIKMAAIMNVLLMKVNFAS